MLFVDFNINFQHIKNFKAVILSKLYYYGGSKVLGKRSDPVLINFLF